MRGEATFSPDIRQAEIESETVHRADGLSSPSLDGSCWGRHAVGMAGSFQAGTVGRATLGRSPDQPPHSVDRGEARWRTELSPACRSRARSVPALGRRLSDPPMI